MRASVGAKPEVFLHRQFDEGAAAIRFVRNAALHDVLGRPAGRYARRRSGFHHWCAPCRRSPAGRRLAGAVGAEERVMPPCSTREVDAVQHLGRAVTACSARTSSSRLRSGRVAEIGLITSGSRCTSAGVPSAIFLPKSSATTWSETRITRFMWCSTSRSVSRTASRMRAAARQARRPRSWFSPPAGSSSSSSFGSLDQRARELDPLLRAERQAHAGARQHRSRSEQRRAAPRRRAQRRSSRAPGRRSALAMKPLRPRMARRPGCCRAPSCGGTARGSGRCGRCRARRCDAAAPQRASGRRKDAPLGER